MLVELKRTLASMFLHWASALTPDGDLRTHVALAKTGDAMMEDQGLPERYRAFAAEADWKHRIAEADRKRRMD